MSDWLSYYKTELSAQLSRFFWLVDIHSTRGNALYALNNMLQVNLWTTLICFDTSDDTKKGRFITMTLFTCKEN